MIFGFGYIYFSIKENRICWVLGFFSSAIFCVVFFFSKIYMQSGLQIFYCLMSIYGWVIWGKGKESIKITSLKIWQNLVYFAFIGMAVVLFSLLFSSFTYEYVFLDLFIAAIALCATYLTSQKIIQCWNYWLFVDALSIYLFSSQDLYLSSLLFVIYFVMSLVGRHQWIKQANKI